MLEPRPVSTLSTQEIATMRTAARLVGAIGRGETGQRIIANADDPAAVACKLAELVCEMLRSHHIEPRQFMEKTLADLAQLEADHD